MNKNIGKPLNPVLPRLGEAREAVLLAKLVNRLKAGQNDPAASLQISNDLDRQPMLLELYVENYVLTGRYSAGQLDEILQMFLLTWLFHEEYYGMEIFQPLTMAVYNKKLTEQVGWAQKHVGNDAAMDKFLERYEPRVLLAHFFIMTAQPSPAMRKLSLDERFNLQLTCMALTACFQAQRKMVEH